MNTRALIAALAAAAALSGCAPPNYGSGAYTGAQVRQSQTVEFGVVEAVREVQIESQKTGVGALSGAALGGLAGSEVGQGKGAVAAAIGGALIGGLAGSAIEGQVGKQQGLEITVRLDSGRIIAVTQGADEFFQHGERVRVLTAADGTARVSH